MKKLVLSLFTIALISSGFAKAADTDTFAYQIALARVNLQNSMLLNIIDWKIGDFQDCNLAIQGMNLGTIHKVAESNEGNGVWLKEVTNGAMIGNHTTETLIDRASGKVLKMKQDGKDTNPGADDFKITHEEKAKITVPAGTFNTIHVTGTSKQSGNVEIWVNQRDINLDGAAQVQLTVQGMPVQIQLAKFGSASN